MSAPDSFVSAAQPSSASTQPAATGGPSPSGRRRRAWWLPLAGLVAAAALVGYGWQRRAGHVSQAAAVTAAAQIPAVRVHVVAAAPGGARLALPATLEPAQRTEIRARASGYVKRWHADLGQRVAAGDVLAELETPDLDQDVRKAEAAVVEARASRGLAQTTVQRFRQLMADNAIARQELDAREAELHVREAALAAAEAALARVQELTGFQSIRAPFAGIVTARRVELGDLVTAGAGGGALFTLEATDSLRAFVDLPQTYVRSVRPGMKVQFRLPEAAGRLFAADVVRTAGALNASTRSMRVELRIPNPTGELMAGAFGQVHFTLARSGEVFAVPATAVRIGAGGATVAVVDAQDRIQTRSVQLGHDLGGSIEILDGLAAGERVVRNPTDLLRPGTQVHVVKAAAQK